jgi:benzoyl-CoA 2,3-dioxygenase component A
VLDFGSISFPVLEGQSIGVIPPGTDKDGKPHYVRLYSIASSREGERPRYNNIALTVKRVTHDHNGNPCKASRRTICATFRKVRKSGSLGRSARAS